MGVRNSSKLYVLHWFRGSKNGVRMYKTYIQETEGRLASVVGGVFTMQRTCKKV